METVSLVTAAAAIIMATALLIYWNRNPDE